MRDRSWPNMKNLQEKILKEFEASGRLYRLMIRVNDFSEEVDRLLMFLKERDENKEKEERVEDEGNDEDEEEHDKAERTMEQCEEHHKERGGRRRRMRRRRGWKCCLREVKVIGGRPIYRSIFDY